MDWPRLKPVALFGVLWIVGLQTSACRARGTCTSCRSPVEGVEQVDSDKIRRDGLDKELALDAFAGMCARHGVSRLLITRGERTLLDLRLDPSAPERLDVMSVTKAVVGLIAGRLAGDKNIPMSTPLRECTALRQNFAGAVTLAHVLSHTSCLRLGVDDEVGAVYASDDVVSLLARSRTVCPPGTLYRYSNLAVNALTDFVETQAGMGLHEYAKKILFDPLGIFGSVWDADRSGHNYAMAGLHLTAAEMARIGQLLLHDGKLQGRRVLPKDVMDRLDVWGVPLPFPGLDVRVGLQDLWSQLQLHRRPRQNKDPRTIDPPDAFSANGYGGQFIVALKRSKIVVVTQRNMDSAGDAPAPALGGQALHEALAAIDRAWSGTQDLSMATRVDRAGATR